MWMREKSTQMSVTQGYRAGLYLLIQELLAIYLPTDSIFVLLGKPF